MAEIACGLARVLADEHRAERLACVRRHRIRPLEDSPLVAAEGLRDLALLACRIRGHWPPRGAESIDREKNEVVVVPHGRGFCAQRRRDCRCRRKRGDPNRSSLRRCRCRGSRPQAVRCWDRRRCNRPLQSTARRRRDPGRSRLAHHGERDPTEGSVRLPDRHRDAGVLPKNHGLSDGHEEGAGRTIVTAIMAESGVAACCPWGRAGTAKCRRLAPANRRPDGDRALAA